MADSYLRCTVCGRTSTTDFASSLRTGWERCCGYTMRPERTDADIEAAIGSAYDVHTCHADCPCQHGDEPPRDFIPAEGSLLPGLLALARLRQREESADEPSSERSSSGPRKEPA